MKAVILAGGLGSRLSEETSLIPKPMVTIGGKPILWHILKIYSRFGINEFIICCGYKGYVIKEYFANYFLHTSDITFDMKDNHMHVHSKHAEPWKVTLIDTGEKTMTGGRLKKISNYLDKESFCFTYGDGLADINLDDLIKTHKQNKNKATITAVKAPGRFGSLTIKENKVLSFKEKPNDWINGGFFVLEPSVIDLIDDYSISWEEEPLNKLSNDRNLTVFKHDGFWHPMDTLRDKNYLESLWQNGQAPWKVW